MVLAMQYNTLSEYDGISQKPCAPQEDSSPSISRRRPVRNTSRSSSNAGGGSRKDNPPKNLDGRHSAVSTPSATITTLARSTMETSHWNQLQDSELNITSTKIHALRPVYRRQHNCASDYARNVDRVFVKESFHSLIIAFLESCGTAWLASQLLEHGMRMRTHSSSTRRQRISLQPSQL